jgi:acyl-CoA thioesterase-1
VFARLIFVLVLALVTACGEPVSPGDGARILVLGDSMLAMNRNTGGAVAQILESGLDEPVTDRSTPGARYFHALPVSGAAGMRIDAQYRSGDWDWVVMNGGGNDILFGCGCGACTRVLDRLVSADGSAGAIPALVGRIRAEGARVIYLGYLRNPGVQTPIKACGPAGNELDRRLAKMAARDPGVTFVALSDLVPWGDRSLSRGRPDPPLGPGQPGHRGARAGLPARHGPPRRLGPLRRHCPRPASVPPKARART